MAGTLLPFAFRKKTEFEKFAEHANYQNGCDTKSEDIAEIWTEVQELRSLSGERRPVLVGLFFN